MASAAGLSASTTASAAPQARGAQMSKTDTSPATVLTCSTRSPGPRPQRLWPTKVRIARCGTSTPFGVPVVPEVYIA